MRTARGLLQETDLEKMVEECQDEPPTGFIRFEKFNTMM